LQPAVLAEADEAWRRPIGQRARRPGRPDPKNFKAADLPRTPLGRRSHNTLNRSLGALLMIVCRC
jgi:hypothetical protein